MPGNNNSNSEQYKLITLNNLSKYTSYIEEKNIQVTRAQYDDLPSTKLTDGKSYYITDESIIINISYLIIFEFSSNSGSFNG